jgi:succinate dehydrogenase / fumarate reductase cytochrome b subunit
VLALVHRKTKLDARPVQYKKYKGGPNSTFASRYMGVTGTIVLLFLILHLINFLVPHRFGVMTGGEELTLYDRVAHVFANPVYSGAYLVSMVILAFHLVHGFQSAFQTLGLQVNKKVTRTLVLIGNVFSIIVPAGFAALPIYFFIIETL